MPFSVTMTNSDYGSLENYISTNDTAVCVNSGSGIGLIPFKSPGGTWYIARVDQRAVTATYTGTLFYIKG